MQLELSRRIEDDLGVIGAYIAQHNSVRAQTFLDELIAEIERVARQPFSFRLRPDIGPDARVAVYGNYVILFRIVGQVVRVERVVHGARRLSQLFP